MFDLDLSKLAEFMFGKDPLKYAFQFAQQMPHGQFQSRKPNQRRIRQEKRRTVFANRHIARGF